MIQTILTLLLIGPLGLVLSQIDLPTTDYAASFATFAAVVALTSVITEAVKKLFKNPIEGWGSRLMSWVLGILLGVFAWIFHLGMFDGLIWWQALLWGFGAGLASNGAYDTGLIEWLFSLFTKKEDNEDK